MATHGKSTPEPYVWLLFSGGGMVAALVLPALLILLGVVVPLGLLGAPKKPMIRIPTRQPHISVRPFRMVPMMPQM